MQPTSVQSVAFKRAPPLPVQPLTRLVFGFPRNWLPRQLRTRLTSLLKISLDACEIGYRDAQDKFVLLDDSDDHDGPEFVLRLLTQREHQIGLHVTIFDNQYQLHVANRQFDIAFLPAADTVQLAAAARWIVRSMNDIDAMD